MILHLLPVIIGAAAILTLLVLVVCAVVAGGRADDLLVVFEAAPEAPAVSPRRSAPVSPVCSVVSLELERARRRTVA
jgi:hypothetical protein